MAAAAVLVVLGVLGVLAVLGTSGPTSVATGARDARVGLFLPASVPAGFQLVEVERAVAGGHVGSPLSFSRAHLVAPDGGVVFADWVAAPSALRSAKASAVEVSPLDGGAVVAVSDTALGATQSEVRWTGAAQSGWLTSASSTAQELGVLARRFVDEGDVFPPAGVEAVPVYDDQAATHLGFRHEDPTVGALELFTYAASFDVAAQQRVVAAGGMPVREVEVAGSVGLAVGREVIWAPADGVTARVQAIHLDAGALLAVASSVRAVSEEAWRAAAQGAGVDPRSFAWRTIARGATRDGGGWTVARREPTDGPGCFNLLVLEQGGGGPAWCGGDPVAMHTMVAARVPASAVDAEIITGVGAVDAQVHPLDHRWSVAVGEVEASAADAPAFEVLAVDADGDPVG